MQFAPSSSIVTRGHQGSRCGAQFAATELSFERLTDNVRRILTQMIAERANQELAALRGAAQLRVRR